MINHKKLYFCARFAAVAQLVERQLPKLQVAGSRPVCRSERQVLCLKKVKKN